MTTTDHQEPATSGTFGAIDAEEHWIGYANQRLNHAQALLDEISATIEALGPGSREHAADLIDTAIEPLERLQRRFGPPGLEHDPDEPPF